jgi:Holliday junction resolvase RusA-like endonuclease
MIEASKKVGPWREAVKEAASFLSEDPLDGPLYIEMKFYLQKPKTVKRLLPTVPPDLDKLVRGLFDALTQAGIWHDDALVVEIGKTEKLYADEDNPPGCQVFIKKL